MGGKSTNSPGVASSILEVRVKVRARAKHGDNVSMRDFTSIVQLPEADSDTPCNTLYVVHEADLHVSLACVSLIDANTVNPIMDADSMVSHLVKCG